jgi:VIT1/CCC1 family predicted Fe2+/Mn2+ transporter
MVPVTHTDHPTPPPIPVAALAQPLKRFHDEAWHTPGGRLVREIIFGLNDGVISTIGFLGGVTATLGDTHTIAVAGMAAAIAGGIAMAMGAFVSSKSQRAFFQAEIAREAWEIEHMPDHEREELREIYGGLGFTPEEVDMIVRRVTSNPELWLRFMAREELGLAEEVFDSPARVAFATGLSYQVGALLLLVPYLLRFAPRGAFMAAAAVAVVTLLVTGAAKTRLTKERPLRAGLELAGLGILACLIGFALGRLVGVAL